MNDMKDQPPGWYRDPGRPNRHRYWNGTHWIGPVGENLRLWACVLNHGSRQEPGPCPRQANSSRAPRSTGQRLDLGHLVCH